MQQTTSATEYGSVDHLAVDHEDSVAAAGCRHHPARPGQFLVGRAQGVVDERHLSRVDAEQTVEAHVAGIARRAGQAVAVLSDVEGVDVAAGAAASAELDRLISGEGPG